ncbi:hypothetical protein SteCoe_19803 [Stentor coeruleus]|uniref:Uncharacterized protein n=1 Tax=Stentor coeruleus TaxID=5963 RepID=A0A1R2BT91_9CILI|nr:hypothetical protein SteCoe_19803 [Stentor coeruleus]
MDLEDLKRMHSQSLRNLYEKQEELKSLQNAKLTIIKEKLYSDVNIIYRNEYSKYLREDEDLLQKLISEKQSEKQKLDIQLEKLEKSNLPRQRLAKELQLQSEIRTKKVLQYENKYKDLENADDFTLSQQLLADINTLKPLYSVLEYYEKEYAKLANYFHHINQKKYSVAPTKRSSLNLTFYFLLTLTILILLSDFFS